MNITDLSSSGSLERSNERPVTIARPKSSAPALAAKVDTAAISSIARDTDAAVKSLVQRLGEEDTSRAELVEQASRRLRSGELDTPEVFRTVAKRLLEGGF